MKEPTSDVSRDLYARLVKASKDDGNAGRRWRANKIIGEFESGFTSESIFIACARKHLKIPRPDQAQLAAEDAAYYAEERARLFEERRAAALARSLEPVRAEPAPVAEKRRRKRRKRLPDGTLPPWSDDEAPKPKRRMPKKRSPKKEQ